MLLATRGKKNAGVIPTTRNSEIRRVARELHTLRSQHTVATSGQRAAIADLVAKRKARGLPAWTACGEHKEAAADSNDEEQLLIYLAPDLRVDKIERAKFLTTVREYARERGVRLEDAARAQVFDDDDEPPIHEFTFVALDDDDDPSEQPRKRRKCA